MIGEIIKQLDDSLTEAAEKCKSHPVIVLLTLLAFILIVLLITVATGGGIPKAQ